MAQAPERGVVQSPLEQNAAGAGLHPVVALPSVQTAPNADFSKVGADNAALAQVLQAGSEFADKQYRESQKADLVDGQMAAQQGKSLEEYNMLSTSHAFVSGFRSMQAQTLADNMYAKQAAAIATGDYELTPDQYRAKQTAAFKGMLTGNEETDRFITQLSVDMNSKLAKEQTLKHEAWKVEESINSGSDLFAGKGKLAATSPQDAEQLAVLLRNPKAIPGMEGLSEAAIKSSVVQGIVKSLDGGYDTVLTSLKGVLNTVQGPAPKESGNIDIAARPRVKNADGSTSTVRSMSFNDGTGEILIPTVVGGKVVSADEAIAEYEKTGKHLGKFNTPEEATAYAEALHKQQETAFTSKGVDGLEKAGFSKEQFASIRESYNRWNEKKQSEFSAGFEQERDDLQEKMRSTNMPNAVYMQSMQDIFAKYAKDPDRQLTLAVREGLAQRGEYSPEVMDLTIKAAGAARNGLSWDKIKPQLDASLDSMGATSQTRRQVYAVAAQGVEGWQRRQEAKADAAYERAQARQEKINTAVQVMNAGGAYALSPEERRLGFNAREQAETQALLKAQQDAKSQGLYFDVQKALDRKNDNMAQFISRQGVVSPLHADKWTAGLMSSVQDGKISPIAQQTAGELLALAKKNPELAMQHLHGDDAKAFGRALIDGVSAGMDPNQALNTAIVKTQNVTASKDATKSAKSISTDLVKDLAPGVFIGAGHWFGVGPGVFNASDVIKNSPVLTNSLLTTANGIKQRYPNFSESQAVEQAALQLKPKVGIIGNNVIISKDRNISETFGLNTPLRNQDELSGIVMHVLNKNGKDLWGSDWEKAQGVISSAARSMGADPKLHMSLDNISKHLIVTTFNEDGSVGTTLRVPAARIGQEWRNTGLDPSQAAGPTIRAAKAVGRVSVGLGKALIGDTKGIGPNNVNK